MRAALLKHPDEALMDDIGKMWSLECSPKYYVDCWMNMMQKFFDVNDALKGIFKNYRKTFNYSLSSTKPWDEKSLVDRLSCLLSALEFQMFSGSCTVCNGTLTIESEATFS